MLFVTLSQYLCTTMTLNRIHHSLVLSGKWLMDSLRSHFGSRSFQVYSIVLRHFSCFLIQFYFFVTASSHCWQECRGHLVPLMHMEPSAASSPVSRKLHQEGITLCPANSIPFSMAPNNHRCWCLSL